MNQQDKEYHQALNDLFFGVDAKKVCPKCGCKWPLAVIYCGYDKAELIYSAKERKGRQKYDTKGIKKSLQQL